jgi:hypothetical protein
MQSCVKDQMTEFVKQFVPLLNPNYDGILSSVLIELFQKHFTTNCPYNVLSQELGRCIKNALGIRTTEYKDERKKLFKFYKLQPISEGLQHLLWGIN